jgi:predicted acetyltransferase
MTSVMVASEARGRRLGAVLGRELLRELYDGGVALCKLYPSTLGFYRRLGFELAGAHTRWRTPLRVAPEAPDLLPETWTDEADWGEIDACYRRYALAQNGLIDRTRAWWETRVHPVGDRPAYRFAVRRHGLVTGYCLSTQEPEPEAGWGPVRDYRYSAVCHDLIWTDEESGRSLLAWAASNRILGVDLVWHGPPTEPLGLLLPEQELRQEWTFAWMARVVHVRVALEERGYPEPLELVVDLDVVDPLLAENAGPTRLAVSGGRGTVERIASATLRLDVNALAALYTGYLPARELVRAGRIEGASAAEIAALELLFAGPRPWLLDQY